MPTTDPTRRTLLAGGAALYTLAAAPLAAQQSRDEIVPLWPKAITLSTLLNGPNFAPLSCTMTRFDESCESVKRSSKLGFPAIVTVRVVALYTTGSATEGGLVGGFVGGLVGGFVGGSVGG